MRVVVQGSELAAATAAAALASVGHRVTWQPHAGQPWVELEQADWLTREPELIAQLEAACRDGALTIGDTKAESAAELTEIDILWLALAPDQRDAAQAAVEQLAARQSAPLVVINNSTFPVGETERLEALMGHAGQVAVALPGLYPPGALAAGQRGYARHGSGA